MSQLILEKVKEAIAVKFAPAIDFKAPYAKVMLDMGAKAAIEALRDLPIGTFDTYTESLVWIKIINQIGKDIALGK